jgi:ribA/ribD-fused uncharacterized protein
MSNFHLCEINYDGMKFTSTEAAYMSAKVLDRTEKEKFQFLNPMEARKAGQLVELRSGWESMKVSVMLEVNREKYKIPYLRGLLLDTGDKYLEETNWWNCTEWGVCNGGGKNLLGKVLMQIREELKA